MKMVLPVFLTPVFLLLLLLLISFRINIEFIAKDSGMTYTIKGNILKVVKVFEIKSGREEKRKKHWRVNNKEKGFIRKRLIGIIKTAIDDQRGKIFHIEKLSVNGTFSIEDAAANAILYGLFLILWQFLLIFLSANFKLEHENFNFLPDFRNDRNELIFHVIFRVVIFNIVMLVLHNLIEARKKKTRKSE